MPNIYDKLNSNYNFNEIVCLNDWIKYYNDPDSYKDVIFNLDPIHILFSPVSSLNNISFVPKISIKHINNDSLLYLAESDINYPFGIDNKFKIFNHIDINNVVSIKDIHTNTVDHKKYATVSFNIDKITQITSFIYNDIKEELNKNNIISTLNNIANDTSYLFITINNKLTGIAQLDVITDFSYYMPKCVVNDEFDLLNIELIKNALEDEKNIDVYIYTSNDDIKHFKMDNDITNDLFFNCLTYIDNQCNQEAMNNSIINSNIFSVDNKKRNTIKNKLLNIIGSVNGNIEESINDGLLGFL